MTEIVLDLGPVNTVDETAFAEASKIATTSRQRRQISQWRGYLKAEEAREATLKG